MPQKMKNRLYAENSDRNFFDILLCFCIMHNLTILFQALQEVAEGSEYNMNKYIAKTQLFSVVNVDIMSLRQTSVYRASAKLFWQK